MVTMHNGENNNSPTPEVLPAVALSAEETTKQAYRLKIWRHLEKNGLASFPRPVYNRIPNFKGAFETAQRLLELDAFKNATNIVVNPDKPQEPIRYAILEAGKNLFVPTTQLKEGLLTQIVIPEQDKVIMRKAVSRNGIETYGKVIGLNDAVNLDLVFVGSVAVSKDGYRIGKGRDHANLAFGLLMQMKAVNPNTLVVTTVHDCQVFESLPADLFDTHDIPIDIIVTPTQVIVTTRSPASLNRPTGIFWNLLSNRRLALLPVVQELREKEMLAGLPCVLKSDDTDIEELAVNRAVGDRPRRPRRYLRRNNTNSDSEHNEVSDSRGNRFRRPRRRMNVPTSAAGGEPSTTAPDTTTQRPKRSKKPRPPILFSVKVSNIERSARMRDLKNALGERGIKPQIISWKGFKGYCYLHFSKPATQLGEGDSNFTQESVCEALSNLSMTLTPAEPNETETKSVPNKLLVEPAKFLTKIETANMTAV